MHADTPKRLIWMVLYGQTQEALARTCIESIRVAGQFDGDICLFTDHLIDADATQVVIPTTTDWQTMCAARVTYGLALDFEKYDELMYLDCDHLVLGPIERLFTELDRLRAMKESKRVMGTHSPANGLLTPQERKQATQPAICAGLVAASSAVMKHALYVWGQTLNYKSDNYYHDQHALNAMVFWGNVPFRYYEPNQLAPVEGEETRLRKATVLHYWAENKKWMQDDWNLWKQQNGMQERLAEQPITFGTFSPPSYVRRPRSGSTP